MVLQFCILWPVLTTCHARFGSLISPYVPLGHQSGSALGCSFVTYGHPEGSAAGDITMIWNDVFKQSVDCSHRFLSLFIFFCHHHHMECLHFLNLESFQYLSLCVNGFLVHYSFCLFTMFTMLSNIYIYINKIYFQEIKWRKQFQIQNYLFPKTFTPDVSTWRSLNQYFSDKKSFKVHYKVIC